MNTPWPLDRNRRPASKLALAAALVLVNLVAHKPVSDLCDRMFALLGRAAYEAAALLVIGAGSLGAAAALYRKRHRNPRQLLSLVFLGAMTIGAGRWLLVSNIELIHFPQFALLAALLLAAGMQPCGAWLLASAAGIVDELYQWRFIYAGVPNTYLDFNDMLLNAMGAAWAVLLWPSAASPEGSAGVTARNGWRLSWAGPVLAVLLLLYLDPPRFDPLLQQAMTGRAYRVLTPGEALGVSVVIWLMIAAVSVRPTFDRRRPLLE
jgi:hypothetical protein